MNCKKCGSDENVKEYQVRGGEPKTPLCQKCVDAKNKKYANDPDHIRRAVEDLKIRRWAEMDKYES